MIIKGITLIYEQYFVIIFQSTVNDVPFLTYIQRVSSKNISIPNFAASYAQFRLLLLQMMLVSICSIR